MSNHYHVVVETSPARADTWSHEEVAERWLRLCKVPNEMTRAHRLAAIAADADRVVELRKRLADLSWFMRYINEPLARFANREDGCSGRFWQGRFHSEALLDERAILSAMAYVDLNPVRAGTANTPELAAHTSLSYRLNPGGDPTHRLAKLDRLGYTLFEYVALVRWIARNDDANEPPPAIVLQEADGRENWRRRIESLRQHRRAHGAVPVLREFAAACGQSWFKGITAAPLH